ncbi:hypothetical protein [Williamwhitmania taraxaci]|uniref:dTDP-4-amino-4,6-dideoxygalactose transaminase n=1 Tax=Williamwhitmania taraxaci TaxID=1640674 RepID=A0A1G6GGR8_9BACT|nr:hypothetical protein [Williamwhitmania taraxaci]SDB81144.1 hypothetical protein SAMN05216323_100133 [Williamwhitmania taraxaci]
MRIGGEFEINPKDLKGLPDFSPKSNILLYSNGRSALMAILSHIKKTNPSIIHIPYYICPSVVFACEASDFQIHFYELNSSFSFPIENLESIKKNEVLLCVNYFGFIESNLLFQRIKEDRPDIIIISDQVQSFWKNEDIWPDYSFTSFRKHFPTPDGAIVVAKNTELNHNKYFDTNTFFWPKFIGSVLKHYHVHDSVYLKFLKEGECKIDATNEITKASEIAYYIFENTNFETIKQKRKENYKLIFELGTKHGLNFLFPYNENTVPLCVPIILESRDSVKASLHSSNIFLPIHWPLADYNSTSLISQRMAEKELSLVIDQRYSTAEMEYQINCLIKSL